MASVDMNSLPKFKQTHTKQLANVSVDLDGIRNYYAIHGLQDVGDTDPVFQVGLPRFLELFDTLNIKATFFVVAADLENAVALAGLRQAVAAGHEIANHTLSHPYQFTNLSRKEIQLEVGEAHRLVERDLGISMVGFRAPGYFINDRSLDVLESLQYKYDSSVFPCPWYLGAKWAVMGVMAIKGHASGAIMGSPLQLKASRLPYRPSKQAYWKPGHRSLVEMPIAVEKKTRTPLIGTSVALMGATPAKWLSKGFSKDSFVGFECHGIDLVDLHDTGLTKNIISAQPDLRKTWEKKRAALAAVVNQLSKTHQFEQLQTCAHAFAQKL
jgi:peptidoglycan/xylan/chitin deacetylase (PgdA/CDA1 family)